MAKDTREDEAAFYPGGKVIPRGPVPTGGGLPADYADVRENAAKGAAHATTEEKNPHKTTFESLPDKPKIPPEVTFDEDVTEKSERGVKSKGIWSWVKGLFSAIFTENEWGDLSFKKTSIGLGVDEDYTTGVELEGAGSYRSFTFPKTGGTLAITKDQQVVFTIKDGAIWNGTTQVLRFMSLYNIAVAGRAILLADVKDAADGGKVVMQAHQVSDHFVRFDATGKVWKGGDVFLEGNDKIVTRSVYAVRNGDWEAPTANDGLRVVWNTSADELMKKADIEDTFAKKSDVPEVTAPASDTALKNKAADAYETGVKLEGKRDKTDFQWVKNSPSRWGNNLTIFIDSRFEVSGQMSRDEIVLDGNYTLTKVEDVEMWRFENDDFIIELVFVDDKHTEVMFGVMWKKYYLSRYEQEYSYPFLSFWYNINGDEYTREYSETFDCKRISDDAEGTLILGADNLTISVQMEKEYQELATIQDIATHEAGGLTDPAKAALFADTAFSEACAYKLVTVGADGVLTDRAINSTESATFVMPKDFTDLIVRFNGTPVSIDWATKETGITDVRGDDLPSESGDYLITFTRTKVAEAFVKVLNIAKE